MSDHDIQSMRGAALRFFESAIQAADPRDAVTRALAENRDMLAAASRIHVVGLGKAARPMVEAALPFAGERLGQAIVLTNPENVGPENVGPLAGVRVIAGGHPLPNAGSLEGGKAIEAIVNAAGDGELVLVLVSGGGSALMTAPAGDITLDDKIALNDLLIRSGADITEINTVRAAVSRLKSGGLAAKAAPAKVLALALSDVPGDDLSVIASGPTFPPRGNAATARAILERLGILDRVAPSVRSHLDRIETSAQDFSHACTLLIGSNHISVEAAADAAKTAGWQVRTRDGWLDGDVGDVAAFVAAEARAMQPGSALICGGETTVAVKGDGLGGRNQELALRVAQALDGFAGTYLFLSGGTDGRDGPTDAAGGMVDKETLARIRDAELDVTAMLARNDSHPALKAAGDLVVTGGTGTNVADIQILLIG